MSHKNALSMLAVSLTVSAGLFAAPPIPRPAPQFTLVQPNGKQLSLASYRGKVVLAQFLYTTCPHCQALSRIYSKLQSELGPRGLQVVGIAFNEEAATPSALTSYVQSNNVNFPLGLASRESVLQYLDISFMTRFVVPQVVVIDRRGVIRAQTDALGSPELMNESTLRPILENLLH